MTTGSICYTVRTASGEICHVDQWWLWHDDAGQAWACGKPVTVLSAQFITVMVR